MQYHLYFNNNILNIQNLHLLYIYFPYINIKNVECVARQTILKI